MIEAHQLAQKMHQFEKDLDDYVIAQNAA